MTVKQLIERLQNLPKQQQDKAVVVNFDDDFGDRFEEVDIVTFLKDQDAVELKGL